MEIIAIKHVLWAQDMDRAVAFWRDAFGLSVRFGDAAWTELAAGEHTVALHGGHDGGRVVSGLSIEVDDMAAAQQALLAAGGRVVHGPERRPGEPIILAGVVDTEVNEFKLTQYVGE